MSTLNNTKLRTLKLLETRRFLLTHHCHTCVVTSAISSSISFHVKKKPNKNTWNSLFDLEEHRPRLLITSEIKCCFWSWKVRYSLYNASTQQSRYEATNCLPWTASWMYFCSCCKHKHCAKWGLGYGQVVCRPRVELEQKLFGSSVFTFFLLC